LANCNIILITGVSTSILNQYIISGDLDCLFITIFNAAALKTYFTYTNWNFKEIKEIERIAYFNHDIDMIF
jgi:hypothetical protein